MTAHMSCRSLTRIWLQIPRWQNDGCTRQGNSICRVNKGKIDGTSDSRDGDTEIKRRLINRRKMMTRLSRTASATQLLLQGYGCISSVYISFRRMPASMLGFLVIFSYYYVNTKRERSQYQRLTQLRYVCCYGWVILSAGQWTLRCGRSRFDLRSVDSGLIYFCFYYSVGATMFTRLSWTACSLTHDWNKVLFKRKLRANVYFEQIWNIHVARSRTKYVNKYYNDFVLAVNKEYWIV